MTAITTTPPQSDNTARIQRSSKRWNAIFSILNAAQSALMMFVIARICGDEKAGVFSFAFSIAYLMIMIGNYGVRNYQSTDVAGRFSTKDYCIHRAITCAVMLAASLAYVFTHSYDAQKSAVIILCCILKMGESIEDVIHGEYQRCGRLDIAGQIGTIRYVATILTFIAVLLINNSLVAALSAMVAVSYIFLIALTLLTYRRVNIPKRPNTAGAKIIFISCLPLFLATFFNIYIINASKYAIDRYYTDDMQGYYGMIFMPVFVINLICVCIYRPRLAELADRWNNGEASFLRSYFFKQLLMIAGISILLIIPSYLIGTQALSIFYGIDLTAYKTEFAILLIGGAFSAFSEFCNCMITVIRRQHNLVWIYGTVAVIVFIISGILVRNYGMIGAAGAYSIALLIQGLLIASCFLITSQKPERTNQ